MKITTGCDSGPHVFTFRYDGDRLRPITKGDPCDCGQTIAPRDQAPARSRVMDFPLRDKEQ